MQQLPSTGFIRQRQLLGDPKAEVPIPAIVPVNSSTLWRWVKTGRFPAPVKIGENVTAWRVEDVRVWCERQAARAAA